MPKISVLMPVYNTKEKYLREAIESIINQTFGDFEFIIINDGSENNVEEVILSYKDKRIKYVKNDYNKGLIFTLNLGLELMQGEYLARMDSDDISLSERLEKQLDFMEKNPEIGISGTWTKFLFKNQIVKHPTLNEEIEKVLLYFYTALSHPTIIIRKNLIDKLNLRYNEADIHAEDYGLLLSLIGKTKFANIPEILLYYRKHRNQISKTYSKIQAQTTYRLMLEAQNRVLGKDICKELGILSKISKNEKIYSDDLKILINNIEHDFNSMDENKYFYINEFKRVYKIIIRNLPKTPKLIWDIWINPINKKLKVSFIFKLKALLSG